MRKITVNGYKRITKQAAKKLYNAGKIVYFCPVNLRPGKPWNPEISFYDCAEDLSFERAVAGFEIYNCTCKETGKYTAFYVEE